jgi:hypothetical protein
MQNRIRDFSCNNLFHFSTFIVFVVSFVICSRLENFVFQQGYPYRTKDDFILFRTYAPSFFLAPTVERVALSYNISFYRLDLSFLLPAPPRLESP